MLPPETKLISVDDHIVEPPHLWQSRLPEKYRAIGPRVVEADDGRHRWAYEDQLVGVEVGVTRTLPGVERDPDVWWARFDEMHPSSYEPAARLGAMDEDGVWGTVAFPQFSRFAGHRFLLGTDKELSLLCVQAYNDFLVEEWCPADPTRLFGMAILPLWDVALSVAEVERMAARGIKAVAFSENPTVLGLPSVHSDHWDPLWAAIEAAGLPICMHIGSSSKMVTSSPEAPVAVALTLTGANSMIACADWLFAGIFDRFPGLRVVLSEGGAGWLPYILERADRVHVHMQRQKWGGRLASEVFAEHMYVCMVDDAFALRSLGPIPEDNLMWECDFPHTDSNFPHSRTLLEKALADVPDDVCVKIASGNARRVFKV